MTFSYTAAFWTWEDWELQLDWMALRGINIPLAWVGQEKILMDVFVDAGFTQAEVISFLSGPAFQAWNRFGNIQGSWGGDLPLSWINSQFELQKLIVARMVELGMTPVLPAFTGFLPRAVERVFPDAAFVNGSQWNGFPSNLTNVTFLEPTDSHFPQLQKSFITKQKEAYGNVTNIYTLDQYNENNPSSGDFGYLRNVTKGTWQSLKDADPEAIWMMQGWLFYSNSAFWTDARIEAYLSGVEVNSDMLILDLFSESQPQWQRTNSYYGKPWIWCELHDYGGNMGLYGQVENVTVNPIQALSNSSSLVGFGLTMEGQEGNEIMYDILLDQAWSSKPLSSALYFSNWVTTRYTGSNSSNSDVSALPATIYTAWDILRTTVYNNTNLTASTAVTKSIFELAPNTTGLLNRTGHHATTLTYHPKDLIHAWSLFLNASATNPALWDNKAYMFDLVDFTRQVLANEFQTLYISFLAAVKTAGNSSATNATAVAQVKRVGDDMVALLTDVDTVLLASGIPYFSLAAWIEAAQAWATPEVVLAGANSSSSSSSPSSSRGSVPSWPSHASSWPGYASSWPSRSIASSHSSSPSSPASSTTSTTTNTTAAAAAAAAAASLYAYNAANQITLWGFTGQISDYSSRQWGGLISSYYLPRWQIFITTILQELANGTAIPANGANAGFSAELLAFELGWDAQGWDQGVDGINGTSRNSSLAEVIGG